MSGTIDNSVNTSLENLPGEVWTRIDDFEGKYEVSNKGRIKVTGSKYNKGTRQGQGTCHEADEIRSRTEVRWEMPVLQIGCGVGGLPTLSCAMKFNNYWSRSLILA